jgi:hypothetical protein
MNQPIETSAMCCGNSCAIENTMARIPANVWIVAALGSISLSLLLKMNDRRDDSRFIGDWAAPFLLLGVYTKLLKMQPVPSCSNLPASR